MGHGHSHRAQDLDDRVRVTTPARNALLAVLAVVAVATVVGLVWWWPDGDSPAASDEAAQYAAPGVTFPDGEVVTVGERCEGNVPDGSGCGMLGVDVGEEGVVEIGVPPEVLESGLGKGDTVELMRIPAQDGATDAEGKPAAASYSYFATDRDGTLVWLGLLFVVVVLAVARLRGLFSLIGLGFGGVVVWWFMLPALLDGSSGVGVALTSATAIMFVVLYMTHGVSMRTSTALAGTLAGIGLTALIGVVAVADARLTGISDDAGAILSAFGDGLDFQSLLGCALVIAGLGVLNDVTITQASAVWELRSATPDASRRAVFASAMRIGRDHIASTIYTIVFAYVGTALIVLMLLHVYDRPVLDLLSTEQLAEEIVRTLATSIGLVLAVPITTALAAVVAAPSADDHP